MFELNPQLIVDAVNHVEACIKVAEAKYNRAFPRPEISFKLKGRTAGVMEWKYNKGKPVYTIFINQGALHKYPEDYMSRTIPHEIAHLITCEIFPYRVKAHGKEWQAIMRECFKLEPSRCHSYKLEKARKVSRPFVYVCACREHELTSILHNRIQKKGQTRVCRSCYEPLILSHKKST